MTTTLDPIRSGSWEMTFPTGISGRFSIDVDQRRWSLHVWPGSTFSGRALTSTGSLDDADRYALAVAFGVTPFPYTE